MVASVEAVKGGGLARARAHPRHRFRLSRAGGFGSLTAFVMLVLLGFTLFSYFHLTFHGLLEGFLHFMAG